MPGHSSTNVSRRAGDRWVLVRAFGGGAALGFAVGGLVGTALVPVAGTIFGELYGLGVGTVLGAVEAPILWLLSWRIVRPPWARVVGALGSASGAAALSGWAGVPWPIALIAVIGCSVLGCWFSPIAVFGARPIAFRAGRVRPFGHWVGLLVMWSIAIGAGLGASAGIVVGLITYWPTAIAAAVEGALIGGFLIGSGPILWLAFIVLGVRTRADY